MNHDATAAGTTVAAVTTWGAAMWNWSDGSFFNLTTMIAFAGLGIGLAANYHDLRINVPQMWRDIKTWKRRGK